MKISWAYLKLFLNDLPGPLRVELDVWEVMDAINDIRDGTLSLETGFMDMSVAAANSIRIVSDELRGLGESAAGGAKKVEQGIVFDWTVTGGDKAVKEMLEERADQLVGAYRGDRIERTYKALATIKFDAAPEGNWSAVVDEELQGVEHLLQELKVDLPGDVFEKFTGQLDLLKASWEGTTEMGGPDIAPWVALLNALNLGDEAWAAYTKESKGAIAATNAGLKEIGASAEDLDLIQDVDWSNWESLPDHITGARIELEAFAAQQKAAMEAFEAQQKAAIEAMEAFEARVTASAERIGDALINAFAGVFAEQPEVWHEQFVNFGDSVKDILSRAFLEPIFGAESAFQGLFETIAEPFAALGDFINDNVFEPLFDGMKEMGLGIWNTLKEYVFAPMIQSLSSFFTQKDVWRTADQAAEISTNAATQTAVVSTNTAAGAASTAAWAPAAVASSIATVGTAIAFGLLATALIRKAFASGGQVDGPGGVDNVPAMLTAGEYVIKKSSVNKLGIPFLERLNQTGEAGFFNQGGAVTVVQRYASGGEVQRGGMFGLGAQSQDPVQVNINIDAHDATGFDRLLAERRGDIVGMIQEGLSTRPNFRKQVQGVARRG